VRSGRETLAAALILALVTLATRAWIFGDPVVNIDEQFYLLVGQRLAEGHLPYVDIWDRKPFGLFAVYGLAARIFPDPVLGYQLLAALAVGLTGWVIFALARRLVGLGPALLGASTYPAWLLVFGGIGGQSPVFYNLPMALAAALVSRAVARGEGRGLTRGGLAAMLLVGLAIQIKYTALFEGIFFGLSLLWVSRRARAPLPLLLGQAAIWALAAWVPTLAAWAIYARLGHGPAFVQANFLSVFGDSNPWLPALGRLAALSFGLFPLWLALWLAHRRWRHARGPAAREARWFVGWAVAAYAGFLPFGVWNDHYALPLLPPLALTAALAFATVRRAWLPSLVLGLGLVGGVARAAVDVRINGTRAELDRVTALVRPQLKGRCLYVNEDLAALYVELPACLPTHYVFPQHLALGRYAHALGVDQHAELRRVLASRPGVIVISTQPDEETDPQARAILLAGLRAAYRVTGSATVGGTPYEVYALQ
jgi:hypothetical protein